MNKNVANGILSTANVDMWASVCVCVCAVRQSVVQCARNILKLFQLYTYFASIFYDYVCMNSIMYD